jgi:hypothetical protein
MNLDRQRIATWYRERGRDWTASAVLAPIAVYFLATRGDYTFLDAADLVIHEAGHFFARPFGRFMTYAGGTLMQLALPSLLVWSFFRNDYRLGTQVSLFWLAHNCINISVYAADARLRRLPLLGGDRSEHDWWNMLGMAGLLAYDQVFGWLFFALAIVLFGLMLMAPRWMLT